MISRSVPPYSMELPPSDDPDLEEEDFLKPRSLASPTLTRFCSPLPPLPPLLAWSPLARVLDSMASPLPLLSERVLGAICCMEPGLSEGTTRP